MINILPLYKLQFHLILCIKTTESESDGKSHIQLQLSTHLVFGKRLKRLLNFLSDKIYLTKNVLTYLHGCLTISHSLKHL